MTELELNKCGEAAKGYALHIVEVVDKRHHLTIEEKSSLSATAIEDFMYGAHWATDNIAKKEPTVSVAKTEWHRNMPNDMPPNDDVVVLILMRGSNKPILGSTIERKFVGDVELWAPIDIAAALTLREMEGGEQ